MLVALQIKTISATALSQKMARADASPAHNTPTAEPMRPLLISEARTDKTHKHVHASPQPSLSPSSFYLPSSSLSIFIAAEATDEPPQHVIEVELAERPTRSELPVWMLARVFMNPRNRVEHLPSGEQPCATPELLRRHAYAQTAWCTSCALGVVAWRGRDGTLKLRRLC